MQLVTLYCIDTKATELEKMQQHRGVGFKVEEKASDEYKSKTRHASLYVWDQLVQQWIFMHSLGVHEVAVDAIDNLIDMGLCKEQFE